MVFDGQYSLRRRCATCLERVYERVAKHLWEPLSTRLASRLARVNVTVLSRICDVSSPVPAMPPLVCFCNGCGYFETEKNLSLCFALSHVCVLECHAFSVAAHPSDVVVSF